MNLTPINDFFSNVKEKITNPFFGTLIVVWLIDNWELVYTLFNFDNDCTLIDKKRFIWEYYQNRSALLDLFCNILYSITALTIGYILVLITRTISNWFELTAWPFLTKRTVSKNIVHRDTYDALEKERDEYFTISSKTRIDLREITKQYDSLLDIYRLQNKTMQEQAEQVKKLNEDAISNQSSFQKLTEQNDIFKKRIDAFNLETKELSIKSEVGEERYTNFKKLISIDDKFWRFDANISPTITRLKNQLKESKKTLEFVRIAHLLNDGKKVSVEHLDDDFKDLIEIDSDKNLYLLPAGYLMLEIRNKYTNYYDFQD